MRGIAMRCGFDWMLYLHLPIIYGLIVFSCMYWLYIITYMGDCGMTVNMV
jgi:hypothetical protein